MRSSGAMRRLFLVGGMAALALVLLGATQRGVLKPTASPSALVAPLSSLESCGAKSAFVERVACYRPVLESHLAARGPRVVLTDLDALQQANPFFAANCHDMAHVLGRYWVASGGSVADGFREGANTCHSGFYHGMVERIIRGDEVLGAEPVHVSPDELRASIPRICTAAALRTESRNIRFQCLHGLGHAAVFSLGYRLPEALAVCDVLPSDWDRRSCHGGTFMENITGVERDRRMLKAGDPHYPCSVVGEPYRESCYVMQTSWMLEMGLGWDAIVAACRDAGAYRLPCVKSFGRDLSPRIRQEGPAAYAERCALLPADERTSCIQGAVYALADHTWDGRYAYPFCAAFTDGTVRAECFGAAQGHLRTSLEQPREKLAENCRAYASSTSECLGALP